MKFSILETSKLVIDKRYQRELDERRVQKISKEFNPRLLGTLEVAQRKGGKWAVFDGQHRLAALRNLGESHVPCLLHEDLTPQQEADLFVALQRDRRNVNPLDRFRARVFSGDKVARAVKKVVEDSGYVVRDYSAEANGHRSIRAITTLERIYRKSDADALADVLDLAKIWNGDPRSTDGQLLEGLWLLQREYGNRVDADAKARLATVSPTVILRRAVGSAAGGGGWSAKLVVAELRKVAGVRGRPRVTA